MHAGFDPHFILDCVSIILIDLLLAGDNALVIAMVVRSLPDRRRTAAIGAGAVMAVLFRVAFTLVAARLLSVDFIRLLGGAFVIWTVVVAVDQNDRSSSSKQARAAISRCRKERRAATR